LSRILAVDTCFGVCSAAVVDKERVLAARHVAMERGHAEALAPMVEAVMNEAGLGFAGLDLLAVTTGPGTFTGQRVGLAFMRGLRVALTKPLIGVTSLAAMAEQARSETGLDRAAAVHDAKRGEVYLEAAGVPAQLMTLAAAETLLGACGRIALAGTAAPCLAPACPEAVVLDILAPDAVWVARLAAQFDSPLAYPSAVPRPLYLRAPDAKLPGAR
jgi:tRNA threonylcarbamoyladenosine biosynthesis protein TsaB